MPETNATAYLALCYDKMQRRELLSTETNKTLLHLQVLKGRKELLAQPSTSTAPGAPLGCHDRSLTRLQLQLGIQLYL
jgi:hypothetical protein